MQNGNLLYESKGCPKKQIIKHILLFFNKFAPQLYVEIQKI